MDEAIYKIMDLPDFCKSDSFLEQVVTEKSKESWKKELWRRGQLNYKGLVKIKVDKFGYVFYELKQKGIKMYKKMTVGSLRTALKEYPSKWVVYISSDSDSMGYDKRVFDIVSDPVSYPHTLHEAHPPQRGIPCSI